MHYLLLFRDSKNINTIDFQAFVLGNAQYDLSINTSINLVRSAFIDFILNCIVS